MIIIELLQVLLYSTNEKVMILNFLIKESDDTKNGHAVEACPLGFLFCFVVRLLSSKSEALVSNDLKVSVNLLKIFTYSLHNKTISSFRRMMTIEQFRSTELAKLYSRRYVDRLIEYHASLFRSLIASGEIRDEDPETLSLMYVAPIITLIGIIMPF